MPVAKPAVHSPTNLTIEDAIDALARTKPGVETDQVIANLVRQGPAAVEEIGRQLAERDPDYARVHNSISVLQAVNDERSRTLLRQLSLGQMTGGNPNLDIRAALALIACDSGEAWKLLSAPTPSVRSTAINSVKGKPVDADRFALLVGCLKDSDFLVRRLAAWTMAEGVGDKLTPQAARAIGAALAAVADLPDAKVTEPVHTPGIALTPSEHTYRDYIHALATLRLDNTSLEEATRPLAGRARDAVSVARGRRGDPSARADLLKLCQDSQAGMFRAWAVEALEKVGTPDDLPTLKQIADTDPLVRDGPVAPGGMFGPRHVVRDAAKGAMAAIETKK